MPSGPKFVNELVERELANYKAEVEIKYKASVMNAEYVFLRRKSAAASSSHAPSNYGHASGTGTIKPEFFLNNFSQATKEIAEFSHE